MQALIAGIAILAGISLGYWIRTISTQSARKHLLEQRNREAAEALAAAASSSWRRRSRCVRCSRRL